MPEIMRFVVGAGRSRARIALRFLALLLAGYVFLFLGLRGIEKVEALSGPMSHDASLYDVHTLASFHDFLGRDASCWGTPSSRHILRALDVCICAQCSVASHRVRGRGGSGGRHYSDYCTHSLQGAALNLMPTQAWPATAFFRTPELRLSTSCGLASGDNFEFGRISSILESSFEYSLSLKSENPVFLGPSNLDCSRVACWPWAGRGGLPSVPRKVSHPRR